MPLDSANSFKRYIFDYIRYEVIPKDYNSSVVGASRYSVLNPFARFRRPLLVVAAARDFGVSNLEDVLPIATAIELVHVASLISDDVADNSHFRRGKPSCHVRFGKNVANLAEHYLVNRAYNILLNSEFSPSLNDKQRIAISELAAKSGIRMTQGQGKDIKQSGLRTPKDIIKMYSEKSGALIGLAIASGGIIGFAAPNDVEYLRQLGDCIGVSYQIFDDCSDAYSTKSETGKPSGQDTGKRTLLNLVGLERAKELKYDEDRRADELLDMLSVEARNLRGAINSIRQEQNFDALITRKNRS